MPTKPIRVASYLRVSKDDGSQETDNQLLQLRGFCERWEGHELVAEYVDRESGTRGRRERKDFDRMFTDAARRRFDVLLFWALDRFSREGIRKTIVYLERLDACGVAFKSYIKKKEVGSIGSDTFATLIPSPQGAGIVDVPRAGA